MNVGDQLWTPPTDVRERSRMGDFMRFLTRTRGLDFDSYERLWQWSVTDVSGFWAAIWEYFEVMGHPPATTVLGDAQMPGATWFPGSSLNYADHVLRMPGIAPDAPAAMPYSQSRADRAGTPHGL